MKSLKKSQRETLNKQMFKCIFLATGKDAKCA